MGMTYGKAISTLESETQEAVEAPVMLEAIDKILSMATINAVKRHNGIFHIAEAISEDAQQLSKYFDTARNYKFDHRGGGSR